MGNIIVVLPAYNEASNIGGLLDRIDHVLKQEELAYRVIVVDDGSSDGTADILEPYRQNIPLTVHRHAANLGLGATIRDGLEEACRSASENDVVVTMDADASHTPDLIPGMVRMIGEGHDVVIASRFQRGAKVVGVSLLRRTLSYGASILFRMVFPTAGVRDFTCGYRVYRAGVLRQATDKYGERFIDASGFQCMADILLKLRSLNVIFGEVPFILRYDLKQGASKMRIARTIRQSLGLMVRRRFER